jgi:ankyrin repeat protein
MYAASNGNVPIIKLLLDNEADIKHKDKQGNDAISRAKQSKHNDVVKLFKATLKERK